MGRLITDLTGRRFGRLTVLSQSPNRYVPGGNVQWYCKCDCGATIEVRGDNLLRGHTNSCGCLRQDGMRRICSRPSGASPAAGRPAHRAPSH